jgi:hypothetical protein
VSFVLTIFSNIFENALTSEIGLELSQFVVSPDLCIGITLVDLSFSGKMPVDKLRLKICARGRSISYDIALRSLELMPSRSVLFLLTRFFIVLPTSMGPHPSSSRCLTVSGSSGQYERGSMSEFGRELAILVPTVEKNTLHTKYVLFSRSENRMSIYPYRTNEVKMTHITVGKP